jgi:hypothetical protein
LSALRAGRTDAIMRRVAAARAAADVRLLGYLDDDVLAVLYAGATMLAYPSLYEGFGPAAARGDGIGRADRGGRPRVVAGGRRRSRHPARPA